MKNKRITCTSITYYNKVLIFNKYDYDTFYLSVGLKLNNTDPSVDHNNMNTKTFTGELYIAENYMNDKRHIEQLQQLRNCTVTYRKSRFASKTGIIDCKIIYKE